MATPALLRRFWPYMARYKGILCFDLFCAALTSVCELVLPLIMRSITNMGVNDLSSLTVSYILRVGALYLVLRLIDGAANYFMANTGHVMGARIETDMRRDAFDHLQKLSDSYFANTKVGQIMGRITNDLFDVTEFAHHCPEEFFIAGLKGVISFIILAGMNVWLTLIVFAVVPVMVVCCTRFNHMVRATFLKQRRHIGELNARIEDSLLGERVVKAFGGEDLEREKFEQDNGRFLDIKKETYRWMAAFNTTTRLFDGLMYLVVIVAGGLFMLYGKIEPLLGMQPRTVETALEPISGKVIFVSLAAFAVAIGAEMLAESGMSLIDWEADWAESTTALAVGMVVAAVIAVVAILVIKARSNGSNAAKTA